MHWNASLGSAYGAGWFCHSWLIRRLYSVGWSFSGRYLSFNQSFRASAKAEATKRGLSCVLRRTACSRGYSTPSQNGSLSPVVSSELDRAPAILVYESIKRFEPVYFASSSRALLRVPFRPDLIHRVVLYQRAAQRCGSAHTKTRGEVSGSGRKPWPQKGTGRARAGSLRAPQFRGGGVAHGPRSTRIWAQKLPKKVRRLGLAAALSRRYEEGRLWVLDHWLEARGSTYGSVESTTSSRSEQATMSSEHTTPAARDAPQSTSPFAKQPSMFSVRNLEHFLNERGWHSALFIGASRCLNPHDMSRDASPVTARQLSEIEFSATEATDLLEQMPQLGYDCAEERQQLERAAANIRADVSVRTSLSVGVYDIVRYPQILLTLNALRELELRVQGQCRVLVQAIRLGPLLNRIQLIRRSPPRSLESGL
ncbi:hypothetical protein CCYA_CCYA05G1474 [Cyanidiococcus yangmingshanensis]|nr:hypothetical protein CCYA_CCYA05G1474 [Cyanidiococcus yangmingshanensis]